MTLRVGDEVVVFALSDDMKHSIVFNNSCLYLDATDLMINDYMQEMMHNKLFQESLNNPQEENTTPLHNKDEIGGKCTKNNEGKSPIQRKSRLNHCSSR